MELKRRLEIAIESLKLLLSRESAEKDFQTWFSQHPVAFEVLGYKRTIEHPSLFYEGKRFIPDFMALTIGEEWEVIELKTADEVFIKNVERRTSFYSEVETYLSQCREYSESFRDTASRSGFNETYGANCSKTPAVKLIVGRSVGLDKNLVNELLSGRIPRVSILTYDDVFNHLQTRLYALRGYVDNPSGIYVALLAMQLSTDLFEDRYILDICKRNGKSRVQIYTHAKFIVMLTSDAHGVVASRMMSHVADLSMLNAFEIVIIPEKDETSIALQLNGELILETVVRSTDFDFKGELNFVFGSNQQGSALSSMRTGGIIIIQGMPSAEERHILRQYLETMQDESGRRYMHEYVGHKFLHNQGHQTLGSLMPYTTNMIQEIEAFKPVVRLIS